MIRREPDFNESADMRLVDLHRKSLGAVKPDIGAWKTQVAPDGPAVEAEIVQPRAGAVVITELVAHPPSDVIPGAIVTLALSISNEGSETARNLRVTVPLPGGAGFRNGSLIRNGQPLLDDAAEALFGTGLGIGELPPRSRATLVWKIGVRLGNKPLVITPMCTAEESAVAGGATLLIGRRELANSGFAHEIVQADRELPFYELDEEETLEHEAGDAALSPIVAPAIDEYQPPIEPPPPSAPPPPAQPEPAAPPDQPMPGEPVQPPDIEPAAREAVVFYGRIDRPSVVYFERMFDGGKSPKLLDHFILGGALACAESADGDDRGLQQHLAAQRQLLQRVVLHEKLGKKEPIVEYTGELLAQLDRFAPVKVREREPLADPNVVLLECELPAPALALLRKMQSESDRWDFTRARQITLAMQGQRVIANVPFETANEADLALRAYAQTAATQLQKFFVRMRLDRTTGLLFTRDETLDGAARRLIHALKALF